MSSVRTTFSRRPEFLTGRSSRRTYTNEIEQNPPSTWVSATLRSLSPGPILLKAWLAFLLLAEKPDSPSVPNNNKIAPAKRNFALRGAVVIQGKKYPLGYSFHWADSFHCRRWFHSYFAKPGGEKWEKRKRKTRKSCVCTISRCEEWICFGDNRQDVWRDRSSNQRKQKEFYL